MATAEEATATIASGTLRGQRHGDTIVYRNIPYAAPPVGPLRFAPPAPPTAWSGVRDATVDGPVPPQNRSRLAHVMGDDHLPQGEDCLSLTLWAPAAAGAKRPVVVWLHGGAYLSGAGSHPWYSGRSFAANGIVSVGVNYRLGALGFLCLPGVSDGNLGLLDQIAALRWVRANIASFGGDPDSVTVIGQSAGGHAIAALMTMPAARGLFRRAIIQSGPMGLPARAKEEAARLGTLYAEGLGLKPGEHAQLKTMPVDQLLKGQIELAGKLRRFADVTPPFLPVVDGKNIPGDIMAGLKAGAAKDIDVVIGTTREEMTAFYAIDKSVQEADDAAIDRVFADTFGADGPAHRRAYGRMRASRRPMAILGDMMTDRRFRAHSLRFAEQQATLGRPAYVYQFDWQSPQFQACHCLEIPFMFDNLADWPDSPMLKGGDAEEMAALAKAMHGAWVAFARSGDPSHDGIPPWRPYEPMQRTTMRFDSITDPIDDLAGLSWRPAWPA